MKAITICAAILTLFALVVLGYSAMDERSMDETGNKPPLIPLLSQGAFFALSGLLLGGLAISLVAAVVYLVKINAFENLRFKGPNWGIISLILRLSMIFLVVYFVAALVLSFFTVDDEEEGGPRMAAEGERVEEVVQEEEPVLQRDELAQTGDAGPRRSFVVAVILVAAASILYFGYRYYRSVSRTTPQELENQHEEMRRDLMSASMRSLERMLDTADHRKAIITAYAIMEEIFAKNGFKRMSHQTPMEYMEQTIFVIARRGGSLPEGALLDLTALYETAKFSDHDILAYHRESAIVDLRDIQHSLSVRKS